MKMTRIVIGLFCFAFLVTSVLAENAGKPATDSAQLSPEYLKLLEMVKKKKQPVKAISGELDIKGQAFVGSDNCQIIVRVFADFPCPYSKKLFENVGQTIKDNLIDTGQVKYVFFDFPLVSKHVNAAKAAEAARCAHEQGKLWEMRKTLYANQKALHEPLLPSHANTAGLDSALFNKCLGSGKYGQSVTLNIETGHSLGVRSTPTLFIGKLHGEKQLIKTMIRGAQPYDMIHREVEKVLVD